MRAAIRAFLRRLRGFVYRYMPAPVRMLAVFCLKMLYGYHIYATIKNINGESAIYLQYYKGTGDVYISSAYLKHCQEKDGGNQKNAIFLVNGGNARRVAELFDLEDITIITLNEIKARSLVWITRFLGNAMLDIRFLHYVSDVPMYTNFLIFLAGLNGIGFMDLYHSTVFQNEEFKLPAPKWHMDEEWANDFFERNQLTTGRTVLIAPMAKSIAEGPGSSFWNKIAIALMKNGYSVCTNVSHPGEKAISGTTGVFIPYEKIASFLSLGGFFIGYRSGLCDLISSVKCRKVILYPQNTWPIYGGLGIGSTLDIFSLKKMGLDNVAMEVEYSKKEETVMIEQIVMYITGD